MGVSKNNGTPKSSILIGFSIINHPFWGTPIFGNTQITHYETFGHIYSVGRFNPSVPIILRFLAYLWTPKPLKHEGFKPLKYG